MTYFIFMRSCVIIKTITDNIRLCATSNFDWSAFYCIYKTVEIHCSSETPIKFILEKSLIHTCSITALFLNYTRAYVEKYRQA